MALGTFSKLYLKQSQAPLDIVLNGSKTGLSCFVSEHRSGSFPITAHSQEMVERSRNDKAGYGGET